MIRVAHPRLTASAVSLAAGLLLLAVTPATGPLEEADLQIFRILARTGDEPVRGVGSLDDPRRLERLGPPEAVEPLSVLRLDDDPERIFEENPPPPADLAVVLARLRERGVRHFGLGYVAGWSEPDTLALAAMRKELDGFEGAVLGFPLANRAAAEPLALPFQGMSMDFMRVKGDAAGMPVVNALGVAGPELGGGRSVGGFTLLLNEGTVEGKEPLLARWDQRVVFALPLALEISRLGISPEEVEVEVGKDIRLGARGPRIAIDGRGMMAVGPEPPELREAAAAAMIGGELPEGFGEAGVMMIDARREMGGRERKWAAGVVAVDGALRAAPRWVGEVEFRRPDPLAELGALFGLALAAGWAAGGRRWWVGLVGGGVLFVGIATGLSLLMVKAGVAALPLAFLAPSVAAVLSGLIARGRGVKTAAAEPAPEPMVETLEVETETSAAAKKAAKKPPKR